MRRRLAAATVASVTAVSVSTISAVTSEANAAAGRSWATKASYTNIKVGGAYTRTSKKVTIKGWLQDLKKNGLAAAVQFRATEGSGKHTSKVYFFKSAGVPADLPYKKDYRSQFFSSDYTKHLYVRECGLTPKKHYKTECGRWQKVY
ncbi:hypothetical protein [Actinomadura rudentiformis]|uniref:Uncharacterized protein n=1 Tax=Actinomadura rudentiformis TaxID=359158 RepID=A0A6H9YHK4_9ACTN|nr:hypothetical protein [Actinomadura rudentiformis]KAB2345941.1 hypothetical protein F8566_24795 [Actinomadura rudentiformis]